MAIERHVRVGDPSPFPIIQLMGGDGTFCTEGIAQHTIGLVEYRYLPFRRNSINNVIAGGQDVVSYNFTGCRMATYKDDGGNFRVCHVSTGENIDCLPQWKAFKLGRRELWEFKPSDEIDTNGGAFMGCYGLITSDLILLSITVVADGNGLIPKIAAIKKARSLRFDTENPD